MQHLSLKKNDYFSRGVPNAIRLKKRSGNAHSLLSALSFEISNLLNAMRKLQTLQEFQKHVMNQQSVQLESTRGGGEKT